MKGPTLLAAVLLSCVGTAAEALEHASCRGSLALACVQVGSDLDGSTDAPHRRLLEHEGVFHASSQPEAGAVDPTSRAVEPHRRDRRFDLDYAEGLSRWIDFNRDGD